MRASLTVCCKQLEHVLRFLDGAFQFFIDASFVCAFHFEFGDLSLRIDEGCALPQLPPQILILICILLHAQQQATTEVAVTNERIGLAFLLQLAHRSVRFVALGMSSRQQRVDSGIHKGRSQVRVLLS